MKFEQLEQYAREGKLSLHEKKVRREPFSAKVIRFAIVKDHVRPYEYPLKVKELKILEKIIYEKA